MKVLTAAILLLFVATAAQGTIIDFQALEHGDSGQEAVPGTPMHYSEKGYDFSSSSPTFSLTTWGTSSANYLGSTALWNGDGTGVTGITTLTRTDGSAFDLLSMQIGELFGSGPGVASVTFNGVVSGGGSVSANMTTDGVRSFGSGFEAFTFVGFANLTSVSWLQVSPYIQFDNVNAEAVMVPEPAASLLIGIGLTVLSLCGGREQRNRG